MPWLTSLAARVVQVQPCTQEKADRVQAKEFADSIKAGTPIASKGDTTDSASGNEPLWLSIAKGKLQIAKDKFKAAGGANKDGTRTIATNWAYIEVQWLNKVKVCANGDVHYEAWSQPHSEHTQAWVQADDESDDEGAKELPYVLTKNKVLKVAIEWEGEPEMVGGRLRYVLSGALYQRLLDAVK